MDAPWTDPLLAGLTIAGGLVAVGLAAAAGRGRRVPAWAWCAGPLALALVGTVRAGAWAWTVPGATDGMELLRATSAALGSGGSALFAGWWLGAVLAALTTALAAAAVGWAGRKRGRVRWRAAGLGGAALAVQVALTAAVVQLDQAFGLTLLTGAVALALAAAVLGFAPDSTDGGEDPAAGVVASAWLTTALGGVGAALMALGTQLSAVSKASFETLLWIEAHGFAASSPPFETSVLTGLGLLAVTAALGAALASRSDGSPARALGPVVAAMVGLFALTAAALSPMGTHVDTVERLAVFQDFALPDRVVQVATGTPMARRPPDLLLSRGSLVLRGEWVCDLPAGAADLDASCRARLGERLKELPSDGADWVLLAEGDASWASVRTVAEMAGTDGAQVQLVALADLEPVLVPLPDGEHQPGASLRSVVR